MMKLKVKVEYLLYLAWILAITATVGSLVFSEVLNWIPCDLCWYQRIFMYPLILILGMGIWLKDKNMPKYVLPLSSIGALIALYHYWIQMVPNSAASCNALVPCTTKYLELFGFVTIPLLSFFGFLTISILMVVVLRRTK